MQVKEKKTGAIKGVPRRIAHGNFFVGSLDKSMGFYNQVAGIEETFRLGERPAGFISNGNTHHDMGLVEVGPHTQDRGIKARAKGILEIPEEYGRRPGLNHFAYEMKHEADLVAAYERATKAGVKMNLVEDRVVTRSVYFADPEGNGIELTADMLSDWRNYRRPGAKLQHEEYIPGKHPPSTQSFYAEDPEIRRTEGAAFHSRRFAHATLIAADYGSMTGFYREIVGFEEVAIEADGQYSLFRGDYAGYSLAIFPATANRPPGVHHIAFELIDKSDFDQVEARLESMKVPVEVRIQHPSKQAIFVRDPDDVLVQFYCEEPDFVDSVGESIPWAIWRVGSPCTCPSFNYRLEENPRCSLS